MFHFVYSSRMENDSLNVENVAADSVQSAGDSVVAASEIQLPTPEQLGISITSGPQGGLHAVTVGDTIDFPVTFGGTCKFRQCKGAYAGGDVPGVGAVC